MMRKSIFAPLLLLPLIAPAQQHVVQPTPPPQGSNWQHVQALRAGTRIQVTTRTSSANCVLKSVDDDSLTCVRGKDRVFQRTEIRSIKIPHKGRSTLLGAAIGAGAGAAIGAAAGGPKTCTSNCGAFSVDFFTRGEVSAVFAVFFGVIGAPVGYCTDLAKSTVYRAP